jgi:WD40 repeat protein
VAFSPDGRYLLFSGMSSYAEKDTIQVWDVASDRMAFKIATLQDQIYHLTFSPDGRLLVVKGTTEEVWDVGRQASRRIEIF